MDITTRNVTPLMYKLVNTEAARNFYKEHGQFRDPQPYEYVHNYGMEGGSFQWTRLSLARDFESIKDECLIRLTDGLEFARHYHCETKGLKGRKYNVMVLDKGKRITVVGWDSLLLALHFAYSRQTVTTRGMRKVMSMDFVSVNHSFKILKPIIEFVSDEFYNKISGIETCVDTPVYQPQKLLKLKPKFILDEDLYAIFKEEMDALLSTPRETVCEWGSKSNSVGTLETCPGEEIFLHSKKKEIPFNYVSKCVDANGFTPIVTAFPKPGSIKSDGSIRVIYPMNITYENALRRFFGKARVNPHPYTFVRGRDFGKPYKHLYDITSCDKNMYGYVFRYGQENNILPLLIPFVCDPCEGGQSKFYYGYHQQQFPSGVFHTSLMNQLFVKSLLRHLGVNNACIQGDGFSSDSDVDHPFVRRVNDFNGFVYSNGRWLYARGHRLNEHKYHRGNGPVGAMRYLIAARSYQFLGAKIDNRQTICAKEKYIPGDLSYSTCKLCRTVMLGGRHIAKFGDYSFFQAVAELYSDIGRISKICMLELDINFDMRGNSWDSLPLENIRAAPHKEYKTKFPRYKLSAYMS